MSAYHLYLLSKCKQIAFKIYLRLLAFILRTSTAFKMFLEVNIIFLGILTLTLPILGFPGGSDGKESSCNEGDPVSIPGSEDLLAEGMATHTSIRAWRISWTEEPGRL